MLKSRLCWQHRRPNTPHWSPRQKVSGGLQSFGTGAEWTMAQRKPVWASWMGLKRPHHVDAKPGILRTEIRGIMADDSRTLASPSWGNKKNELQAEAEEWKANTEVGLKQEQSKPKEEGSQEKKCGSLGQMDQSLSRYLPGEGFLFYNLKTVKMKKPHTEVRCSGASTWGNRVWGATWLKTARPPAASSSEVFLTETVIVLRASSCLGNLRTWQSQAGVCRDKSSKTRLQQQLETGRWKMSQWIFHFKFSPLLERVLFILSFE